MTRFALFACAAVLAVPPAIRATVPVFPAADAGADCAGPGGGPRTAPGGVVVDDCLGQVGGLAAAAAFDVRNGPCGQLCDVASLAIHGTPSTLNEGSGCQLGAVAVLDDATVTVLGGNQVTWSPPAFPLATIDVTGWATAGSVWTTTAAVVHGSFGLVGSGALTVLDVNPDNFGIYGNDRIPDAWQVGYFGVNNPLGMGGADADGTGQNNYCKYVADLNPTNPASVFAIVAISNQSPARLVYFPSSAARVYTLEYAGDLSAGPWTNQAGATPVAGTGGVMPLNDTNAVAGRFYRVTVEVP